MANCMNPELSILVITYNEEEYVAETLEKILSQKVNFEYEILCHDDASTDRTQEIIMEYQKLYPNKIIPIFQSDNKMQKGHQIVVEYCYPMARGKYIAYCDGDDYWSDENKLQMQYDFLESNKEYTLCLHDFDFLDVESGKRYPSKCGSNDRDMMVEEFILWDSQKIPQLGTSMFRTKLAKERPELFIKIGGGKNSLRPISDHPLYIYLALQGKVKYFGKNMSVWRRRGAKSWGVTSDKERIIQFNLDKIAFFEELNKITQFRYKECIEKAIERCLFTISWLNMDFYKAKKYVKSMDRGWVFNTVLNIMSFCPRLSKKLLKYRKQIKNKLKE
jgi:glycosyltransferase